MARLFGDNSPTTTCNRVISAIARTAESPKPAIGAASPRTPWKSSSNTGSPTTPRPRLATVIPS
jgi:hypothetical protein